MNPLFGDVPKKSINGVVMTNGETKMALTSNIQGCTLTTKWTPRWNGNIFGRICSVVCGQGEHSATAEGFHLLGFKGEPVLTTEQSAYWRAYSYHSRLARQLDMAVSFGPTLVQHWTDNDPY